MHYNVLFDYHHATKYRIGVRDYRMHTVLHIYTYTIDNNAYAAK